MMRCTRPHHIGDRDVPDWEWSDSTLCCRTCINRYVRERFHARRGHAADPPAGYIPTRLAAERLGCKPNWVTEQINIGNWFRGDIWQRGKRGHIFIRESAVMALVQQREAGIT